MSPTVSGQEELLGRRLAGRYRLESLLARGGMAAVYRGVDERLQRSVAVKVLAPAYRDDASFVARFLEEGRTAAAFSHPNLAHVYDSGSDGSVHYMVMELLDGHRSLRTEIRERGPLGPLHAIEVMLDVLAALEPLHARSLVHCDVKSGNVMIGPGGTRLIDFGIARPSRRSAQGETSIGSLHAMSPEQLRNEPLTPASDLFAVGVVLFEALTGKAPFPGDTPDEVAAAHRRGPVAAPSVLRPRVAPRLDDVVLQALRLDPAGRFKSAPAMATALRTAADEQRRAEAGVDADATTAVHPVATPAPRPAPRSGGRRPRRWVSLAAVAVALVGVPVLALAVLLGIGTADGRGEPSGQPPAAASPTPTLAPGTVRVPNTIGMSEAEAEAAARQAGLAWRIEWQVVPGREPGIHDQEPPPGRVVQAGSRFVMYAYRSR